MPESLLIYVRAIAAKYGVSEDTAFEILVMVLMLDRPFDEVHSSIWTGGPADCGIDGVYIDIPSNTISLFQSKNSLSLGETEMTAFRTSYQEIFVQGNTANRVMNPKLQAVFEEYKEATARGVVLEPKLFYAYSGDNSDPTYRSNDQLSRQFSTAGSPPFTIVDIPVLVGRGAALQKTHREEVQFTFQALETNITPYTEQALFSFYIGDVKAVNFRMTARQLCDLMEREISINGSVDTLYTDNIRAYLKKNKTNKHIDETLRNRAESPFFPFMNNGITIICSAVTIPADPQAGVYNIPVTNPVIVNGLQTSRVIYGVYKDDPTLLDNVHVTVKVYETRNQDIVDLITEATNTQTAINYRDQMSNKPFNGWARDHFAAYRVKYVSKRGESIREPSLTQGLLDSITNETVIKFWYATYQGDP